MTNYVTLRNRIADEIYDTTLTTNVNEAIQSAIKHYERRKLWFNQKTGTFATVADQEYYGSSANTDIPDLLEIFSMVGSLSGTKMPIRPVEFSTIDDAQTGSVKAFPEQFAYFNEQIRLYPIPDGAYTVTMAYHYRLAALSADGDTNAWTTDAEELIRTRAKRLLALHKLWDVEMWTRLEPLERELFTTLQNETRMRRSNRMLRTEIGVRSGFNINVG